MSTLTNAMTSPRRRPAALTLLLPLVIALFLGILVFVYVETKRANPILLDEQGRPTAPAHEDYAPGQH